MKLEELGYSDKLEKSRSEQNLKDFEIGRVISEHKERYIVKTEKGELESEITGNLRFSSKSREDFPAVGDWVAISPADNEKVTIQAILPRKTSLWTKNSNGEAQIIATNIDIAFIVGTVNRDFNLNRIERYLVLAREGKIEPVIVLNKIDLVSDEELNEKLDELQKRFANIEIIPTSTETANGLEKLTNIINKGTTYCFLGSSGVGKSSLINKLLKANNIATKQIGESTDRGKHTTTRREMHFLKNGGILIDNPGIREVGVGNSEIGIETVFDEIETLSSSCRFSNCTHTNEPGCAVRKALEENELDEQKYENFTKLKKESDFYEMSNFERREKDRKFGKFIKKSLKKLDKYN